MELLVRTVDKTNPDNPYLDCQLHKAGDVIVICPDGWQWGRAELNSTEHVIVRVPDVPDGSLDALIVEEPNIGGVQTRMRQRRAFRLDLSKLPSGAVTLSQVMEAAYRVPSLPDPNVL